jgi:hypothetical protein
MLRPPPLQQPFAQHAAHDVGQRRAVDAGAADELGLAEPRTLRDGDENGELAWREVRLRDLRCEKLLCALTGTMQKMDGRPVEPV